MLSSGRLNRFGTSAWSKPMAFHAKVVRVLQESSNRAGVATLRSRGGTGPWHPVLKLAKLLRMGAPSQG